MTSSDHSSALSSVPAAMETTTVQANPAPSSVLRDFFPKSVGSMSSLRFSQHNSSKLCRETVGEVTNIARHLHRAAQEHACDKKSPVGALLITEDAGEPIVGFNNVTADLPQDKREEILLSHLGKENWILHAERSALYEAVRRGRKVKKSFLITTKFPCHVCAQTIACMGVSAVASPIYDLNNPKWADSFKASLSILETFGVEWMEIPNVRRE